MDRTIQPGLMIAGCVVLVVAAVALPAALLNPARYVAPVYETPVAQNPLAEAPVQQEAQLTKPPAAEIPAQQAPVAAPPDAKRPVTAPPVAEAPAPAPPSTNPSVAETPVQPAPTAKPPARSSRRQTAKAPKQAPAPPPTASAPPAQDETTEGDGLSRGQRFRIVQQETLKQLGPGAMLASSLAQAFAFPTHRKDAVFGIDVSHFTTENCDCTIDWDRIAEQKVTFVYAKATEGIRYKDPSFKMHWNELAKHPKIHRGAYHFLRADVDIETQVKNFVGHVGKLQANDLPPVMDLEWDKVKDSTRTWTPKKDGDYWSNLSPDQIIERALKWLQLVEKETGRIPVVYTSRTWWKDRGIDEEKLVLLKRYPIWISAMENEDLRLEKPGTKGAWGGKWNWTLWQFTNMGDLTSAGIPNPKDPDDERTDVSIFPGTLDKFQQAMGLAASIEVTDKSAPGTTIVNPTGTTAENTSPGSSVAPPTLPQTEPPKDKQAEVIPEADKNPVKPSESDATGTPGTNGVVVMPEPAKDPPKDKQAEVVPETDNNAVKPPETSPSGTPGTDGVIAMQEPSKDPPVVVAPEANNTDAKPADPGTTGNAGTNGIVVTPSEPAKDPAKEAKAEVVPEANATTDKPAEIAAPGSTGTNTVPVTPPEPPSDPPKEAQIPAAPAVEDNATKTTESTATTSPGVVVGVVTTPDQPQQPQTEVQTPIASGTDKVASIIPGNDGAAGSSSLPMVQSPDRSEIEIVLKNGRKLRVDQSIDPDVLKRLIATLEK